MLVQERVVVENCSSRTGSTQLIELLTSFIDQLADYTEPYRKVDSTGDDLEKLIVEAIASINSTVTVE